MLDLSDAHKQLAIKPEQAYAAVVAALDESTNEALFFLAKTLLFGETAAVYGFNGVARLLEKIAVRMANLVCTNYFDDYAQLETGKLGTSAEECME